MRRPHPAPRSLVPPTVTVSAIIGLCLWPVSLDGSGPPGSVKTIRGSPRNETPVAVADLPPPLRLRTPEGILLLYDPPAAFALPAPQRGFVGLWHDFGTGRAFVFDRVLTTAEETGLALAALRVEFTLPDSSLAPLEERLARADVGCGDRGTGGAWVPASWAAIVRLIDPTAEGGVAVGDGPSPFAEKCPPPSAATLPGAKEWRGPRSTWPVGSQGRLEPVAAPLPEMTTEGWGAAAAAMIDCTDDDGGCTGPCCGSTDPCCGQPAPCDPTPNCPGDVDCDGIPNSEDGDVDGDGIPNGSDGDVDGDGADNGGDPDIDGDGQPNGNDGDVDGDGFPNGFDNDTDGDGTPNRNDGDIDGDGSDNGDDSDMDGDGWDNGSDSDTDGDGDPNDEDPSPDGCTQECCGSSDPCCGGCDNGLVCDGREICEAGVGCVTEAGSVPCEPCEVCDPSYPLGKCSPACGCSPFPAPPSGRVVDRTECESLCWPESAEIYPECSVEFECWREDFNGLLISAGVVRNVVLADICCANCPPGCAENPPSPPPLPSTCSSNAQGCYNSTVDFSLAANISSSQIPFVEAALEGLLGFSRGSQLCAGGSCTVSAAPCGWVQASHTYTLKEGVEAELRHRWRWYHHYQRNGRPQCECRVLNTECSNARISTASGDHGISIQCDTIGNGSCPPNACVPGN